MLRRSWLWICEQLAFLLVLLLAAGGFGYLLLQPTRAGRSAATAAIAAALLLGGAVRLTLPKLRVGMLAVRGRLFDALCYLSMGGALLVLDLRLRT